MSASAIADYVALERHARVLVAQGTEPALLGAQVIGALAVMRTRVAQQAAMMAAQVAGAPAWSCLSEPEFRASLARLDADLGSMPVGSADAVAAGQASVDLLVVQANRELCHTPAGGDGERMRGLVSLGIERALLAELEATYRTGRATLVAGAPAPATALAVGRTCYATYGVEVPRTGFFARPSAPVPPDSLPVAGYDLVPWARGVVTTYDEIVRAAPDVAALAAVERGLGTGAAGGAEVPARLRQLRFVEEMVADVTARETPYARALGRPEGEPAPWGVDASGAAASAPRRTDVGALAATSAYWRTLSHGDPLRMYAEAAAAAGPTSAPLVASAVEAALVRRHQALASDAVTTPQGESVRRPLGWDLELRLGSALARAHAAGTVPELLDEAAARYGEQDLEFVRLDRAASRLAELRLVEAAVQGLRPIARGATTAVPRWPDDEAVQALVAFAFQEEEPVMALTDHHGELVPWQDLVARHWDAVRRPDAIAQLGEGPTLVVTGYGATPDERVDERMDERMDERTEEAPVRVRPTDPAAAEPPATAGVPGYGQAARTGSAAPFVGWHVAG